LTEFHLLANPNVSIIKDEFELDNGYIIRKPKSEELKVIRHWISMMLSVIVSHEHPYESNYRLLDGTHLQKWRRTEDEILGGNNYYWIMDTGKNDLRWEETIPMILTKNKLIRLARFKGEKLTRIYSQTFVYLQETIWDFHYNLQAYSDQNFILEF